MDGDLVYRNNIKELREELLLEHTSGQWIGFTDSSEARVKAVLLHNGNKFTLIPLIHAVHVKETYENPHVLLQ